MRILYWHGWLLDGTGANVYSAKVTAHWRRAGHEVVLLCQQRRLEHLDFVDAWGTVGAAGVSELAPTEVAPARGRVVLLRPDIGSLLPVFVYDEYEGFEVKSFLDLTDAELRDYLERNAVAMRTAAAWGRPDVVVAGHAMAGPPIALAAVGPKRYVAKVHGSDLEYAARAQDRYRRLAREGLEGAIRVAGASRDVLARAERVAPGIRGRTVVVPPGVDVDRWRPRGRAEALEAAAERLEADPDTARGRPDSLDSPVRGALGERDGDRLDALAGSYDQSAPDPSAPARLRSLGRYRGPLVGYLGKLIPQKGVERFIEALAISGPEARGLVVGFGTFREWLAVLVATLDRGDAEAWEWLARVSPMRLELTPEEVSASAGFGKRVDFTGRLDHRYAPEAVAAMDILVVPSTLDEAFGMVAAEAAAAGSLPLVARHSALAEVAEALERAAAAPGLLSFEPGPGATRRLAEGLGRILELPDDEAVSVRAAVRDHVASEWTWPRTAERLLGAARP